MPIDDVIIVGGGIAGLTAALALLRQGLDVSVYEQAAAFGEVGAGISLSQPATRGLFSLGLADAIEREADRPARACTVDFATGEAVIGSDLVAAAQAAGGAIPYFFQMHRADLHRILTDRITALHPGAIKRGRRLTSILQDGDSVFANFEDGSTARALVLIGADGVHSTVRELLFGPDQPRFTGHVAYRFLVPADRVRAHLGHGPSVRYAGAGRMLLRYLIRHGSLVNGVGFAATDGWTGEGWVTPVPREELLARFAGANPELAALLEAAPIEGTRKWALLDREPLPHWTVGRVSLIGDAAHPALPFLGLGAALGIEDGVVLGRAFATHDDPCDALYVYETSRKGRTRNVQLASRRQGEIDLHANAGAARDAAVEDLMRYDPATVPLAA